MRPAGPTDLATLLSLMRAYYAHDHLTFDEQRTRAAAEGLLSDPSLGQVWLIEDGPAVVGYAVLVYGYSLEYGGRAATLDELYLRPEARGRGLGARALQCLEDFCRSRGIRSLQVEVEGANGDAQSFYRSAGFLGRDRTFFMKEILADKD